MKTRKAKSDSGANAFAGVFARLRAILQTHASRFVVSRNSDDYYCLEGGRHPKHQTPMPLAWVQIGKAYVRFHHMGVYGCPTLMDQHSAALKARMQGKSCFNFTTIDEELFAELAELTAQAFAVLRKVGGSS